MTTLSNDRKLIQCEQCDLHCIISVKTYRKIAEFEKSPPCLFADKIPIWFRKVHTKRDEYGLTRKQRVVYNLITNQWQDIQKIKTAIQANKDLRYSHAHYWLSNYLAVLLKKGVIERKGSRSETAYKKKENGLKHLRQKNNCLMNAACDVKTGCAIEYIRGKSKK